MYSSPPTLEVGGTVLDPSESEGPEGVPKVTTIQEGRRTGEVYFLKQSPGSQIICIGRPPMHPYHETLGKKSEKAGYHSPAAAAVAAPSAP